MPELVERYVHQVGRYLAPKERAEIEAELRSQIEDQLEDRFGPSPSQENTATLLTELGHPYLMAASYSSEQYLVGPILYPYMMMVLRYGWLLVPTTVVFWNIFGALLSLQSGSWLELALRTVIDAVHLTLIFSAVVVLFFAAIQHKVVKIEETVPFNPLELAKVDDPAAVDRFEQIVGIGFGTFILVVLVYFLSVGGLTLRLNPTDPGDIIPVSAGWLSALIVSVVIMLIVPVIVLRRNRWTSGLWLFETVVEVIGAVCLYFAVYVPIVERVSMTVPSLNETGWLDKGVALLAALSATGTLIGRGRKLIQLWNYGRDRKVKVVAYP
jgi:hypothetical protein